MARSSIMVTAEIAVVEASNTTCQNGINECNAKIQQLQDRIDELGAKKSILESTYSVYVDLKNYIGEHLSRLEDTSVCIMEIKEEGTMQINDKLDTTLKVLYDLITNLTTAIGNATTEFNTTYSQLQTYQTNLSKGQERLGTLNTELEEAKAQELPTM